MEKIQEDCMKSSGSRIIRAVRSYAGSSMTREVIKEIYYLFEAYPHILYRLLDVANDIERNGSVGEKECAEIEYLGNQCEELAGELKKLHRKLT